MKNFFLAILMSSLFLNQSFASIENANFLAEKWIITNKSSNPVEYKLKNNILRQEVSAVVLWIFWWKPENFCKWIFRDVSDKKPNSWACKTIEALEKYDIVSDDNLYFKPEAKITKSEALGMLIKASFDEKYDFESDKIYIKWNWQKQVVDFAVSKWIVKNFYDYNSFATRDFIFDIWANILKYKNNLEKHKIEAKNNNLKISELEAKNIALKNAWINENQTFWLQIKKDFENWKLYYEVDFFQNNKKFEYKIDSENWNIIEFDIDNN